MVHLYTVSYSNRYLYDKKSWDAPKSAEDQNVQTQKSNNIYFLVIHALEDYTHASSSAMPGLPAEQFTKLDYNLRTATSTSFLNIPRAFLDTPVLYLALVGC